MWSGPLRAYDVHCTGQTGRVGGALLQVAELLAAGASGHRLLHDVRCHYTRAGPGTGSGSGSGRRTRGLVDDCLGPSYLHQLHSEVQLQALMQYHKSAVAVACNRYTNTATGVTSSDLSMLHNMHILQGSETSAAAEAYELQYRAGVLFHRRGLHHLVALLPLLQCTTPAYPAPSDSENSKHPHTLLGAEVQQRLQAGRDLACMAALCNAADRQKYARTQRVSAETGGGERRGGDVSKDRNAVAMHAIEVELGGHQRALFRGF